MASTYQALFSEFGSSRDFHWLFHLASILPATPFRCALVQPDERACFSRGRPEKPKQMRSSVAFGAGSKNGSCRFESSARGPNVPMTTVEASARETTTQYQRNLSSQLQLASSFGGQRSNVLRRCCDGT